MRRILWLILIAAFSTNFAFGWGCDGHQIVALIARAHLTPEVSKAVNDLLLANPVDPAVRHLCTERSDDPMVDSASYADDVRTQEKIAPWHYVNIPRGASARSSLEPWCPPLGPSVDGKDKPGCVVNALDAQLAILRDKSRPAAERANALRFVVHFVGDLHQPLHSVDNNDQGGNCITIQFAGDDRISNLHSIWDSRIIQYQLNAEKLSKPAYVEALNSRFASKYRALEAAPADDPASWAWEAQSVARAVTYGSLEPAVSVLPENPVLACPAEREQTRALHIVIGETYIRKATPALEEQLATAGFRLGLLLNSVL